MKVIATILGMLLMSILVSAQEKKINDLLIGLKRAKADTSKVILLKQLADYYISNKPEAATYYGTQGLTLSRQLGYKKGIATMLIIQTRALVVQGQFDLANTKLDTALKIAPEINNTHVIADIYLNKGRVQERKTNFEVATSFYLKSLKIYESLHDNYGRMASYRGLGVINAHLNNVKLANQYFNTCIEIGSKLPVSEEFVYSYMCIGALSGINGDLKNAYKYLKIGLLKSAGGEFTIQRAGLILNLAEVSTQLKRYDEAKKFYDDALAFSRKNHLLQHEAWALLGIALILDNTDTSIPYFDQALAISYKADLKSTITTIYNSMIAFYKKHDNYKKALELSDRYHVRQDSTFSVEKTKQIANLQSTFELGESKLKVQQLELDKYKSNNQRNITLLLATAFLVIIIIIAINYAKHQKLYSLLNIQKEDLDTLNTIKDRIFSIIGHDLRGPMATISSTLYLLEKDLITEEEREKLIKRLKVLNRSSFDTLNKLLYWGSSQLNGVFIDPTSFNAKESVAQSLNLIKDAAEIKEIEIIDDVPEILQVYADLNHFEFIIRNILHNALKYTNKHGTITVSVVDDKDTRYTTLSVKDNGTGIDAEIKKKLFGDNYISTVGTNKENGTGLGLMLCKEFIESNGGKIWVESEHGKGSVFYASFPSHKQ